MTLFILPIAKYTAENMEVEKCIIVLNAVLMWELINQDQKKHTVIGEDLQAVFADRGENESHNTEGRELNYPADHRRNGV